MHIFLQGAIGGLLVILIAWTSRRGALWPGILPLFPALAAFALWTAGAKSEAGAFRETSVAAIKTIPPYLPFLATSYACSTRIDYRLSLLVGVSAWIIAAALIFALPRVLR